MYTKTSSRFLVDILFWNMFFAPIDVKSIWLRPTRFLTLSVLDECYSRRPSCTLMLSMKGDHK
jgi:hypothetical protein